MTHRFLNPYETIQNLSYHSLGRVVDAGSGVGYWNTALAHKSSEIISIDSQPALLSANSVNNLRNNSLKHAKVCGDISKDGGTYVSDFMADTILLSNVLFQLKPIERLSCVSELRRIIKPHGKVICVDWLDSWNGIGPHRYNIITEEVSKKLFRDAGFTISAESMYTGTYHYGFIAQAKI
jgi:SAM-dependent methyltransferase